MKETITNSEWQTLLFCPLWIFTAVGGADSQIDEQEIYAFAEELRDYDKFNNHITREIMENLGKNLPQNMMEFRQDTRDIFTGLREVKEVLQVYVAADDIDFIADDFFQMGIRIAKASLDTTSPDGINNEEQAVLDLIASTLILQSHILV